MTKRLKRLKHKDWVAEIVCYQGSFTSLGRRRPPKTLVVGTAQPHPWEEARRQAMGRGPSARICTIFSAEWRPPSWGLNKGNMALKSTAHPQYSGLALWCKTTVVSLAYGTHCRLTGNCVIWGAFNPPLFSGNPTGELQRAYPNSQGTKSRGVRMDSLWNY